MRFASSLAAALILFSSHLLAQPLHLLCNHLDNPLGLDSPNPRFSWQNNESKSNWTQSAYRVLVSSSAELSKKSRGDVWDSGKVSSAESVGISYAGAKLESRKRYFWTVQVWDGSGPALRTSQPAWFEMGLLLADDWHAKWITRTNPDEAADRAAMKWLALPEGIQNLPAKTSGTFHKTFQLTERPQRAALFLIGRGDYSAVINGHAITTKADWSDFDRKDITSELVAGENTIELRLASHPPSPYGPRPKYQPTVIAGLLKMYKNDGTLTRLGTDETWGRVAGDLSDETMNTPGPLPAPAALFRHEFQVKSSVRSARLYITAMGSYRAVINGQAPSRDLMTPDFTDYKKHVEYQSYDVTPLLKTGANAIGLTLGDGWYGSPMTWTGSRPNQPPNRVIAQLEIHYSDGQADRVATDSDWRTTESAIQMSQIYAGEDYDARREKLGWDAAGFHDDAWDKAAVAEAPATKLIGVMTVPVHINSEIKPVSVKPSANGGFIFDFGQNMVGWTKLNVRGAAGTRVRMRFAEILTPDGGIYRDNLRNADATDTYTLKGGAQEVYEPTFTFHGFRYVEVTGYPGTPDLNSLVGEVANSLTEPNSGTLATSSDLLNKMWKIGLWGQRGNFFSIPTDCPQRDERLGWMGDAGVFWRTGTYNFDISAFTRKFMLDVVDAQSSKGDFANVSPDLLHSEMPGAEGAPGWSDAGVIVPFTGWMQYGDTSYIDDNWDAMQRFMKYILDANPDFIRKNGNGPNFADWLAPDPHSPQDLVATAYWALSADMMRQMADATGRKQDAEAYAHLIEQIRAAYQTTYIKPTGEVAGDTQTAYLLTLYAKLAPKELEAAMVQRLVDDIQKRGGHLSTGFLGTPFLLFTLAEHRRADVAYKLLLNETYPSWGYMLSKGATTWWERWNGDSGDPAMNSFNHYAFGSVMAWVYRSVAGIDTAADGAGFRHVVIHPQIDSAISHARGEYDSAYGKVVTDWTYENGKFKLTVELPANTHARVYLPQLEGAQGRQDGKKLSKSVAEAGSGKHQFTVGR